MDALAQRLSDATLALCRVPSPTGQEARLCDAVAAWAASLSVPVRRVGNALVVGRPPAGGPAIALAGHLDTVPDFPGDGPPRRAGGRIHGKGASDMKGGLAVAMALYEALAGRRRAPVLVFYDREEGPYSDNGLDPLFASGALPELDLAICLEPTANALSPGCVGSVHATVRYRGKSAHSARPWEGKNAVHAAAPLLARLAASAPREVEVDGLTFREVASITRAAGGQARNVVPDLFELNLNYRFAPGKPLDHAQADVRALVGDGAEIEFTDLAPGGPVCLGNPVVRRLREAVARVEPKQAWTDVARFAARGIDAVNFGPGEPSQAHQVDEWADADALVAAYRILERLFE